MLRRLSIAAALVAVGAAVAAQTHRQNSAGLSGYVLAPDGMPVSGGDVVLLGTGGRSAAVIGADGRFDIEALGTGTHELQVNVPDLAPYRIGVTVPSSRTLELPVIRLTAATYFHVRLVTAAGDPIGPQHVRRQSFTAAGVALSDPLNQRAADAVDADGTITIGPLARGMTVMTVDAPGLARTRLPDVQVDGSTPLLEGGTVVVQEGSVLHVAVVDGNGSPVPAHDVFLEDVRPFAPVSVPPVRTDSQGRAAFSRLAGGQYRVRTETVSRCGNVPLWIAPIVSVSGNGTSQRRLVVGGMARLRLDSPHGELPNVAVSAAPEAGTRPLPPALLALRDAALLARYEPSCERVTDANGRAVFEHFPPGPASVRVQLPNSILVRRIVVPEDGREMVVPVPEGLLAVRVTSAGTNRPLPGAELSWTGGGARIDARTTASGDALLEGVAAAGGTLAISASGHEPAEVQLAELPATTVDVTLDRAPSPILRARVVSAAGAPIPSAVIELAPASPGEIGHIDVTDRTGHVAFTNAPRLPFLTAFASGFAPVTRQITDGERTGAVLTLTPGYRAMLSIGVPSDAVRLAIRVFNDRGVAVDHLLDSHSDRTLDPPGAISLGPLPPGRYTVEIAGAAPRRITLHIVDRDVAVEVPEARF